MAANSPEVFIHSPADDSSLLGARPLILRATAYDPEDGRLGLSSIRWSSSIDGALGTGGSLAISTSDLTAGVHELTATATDSSGASGSASVTWSGGIKVPLPAAPGGLKASGGSGSVDLSWDNPANATITGYRYRTKTGTGGYGAWQTVTGAGASTTSHTITGLTATGTSYDIELQAGNGSGWGAAARTSATTGPANSPTGVTAAPGNASIVLSWDSPPSGYGITMHRYRYEVADSGSWTSWTELPAATTTATITGLTNGTSYRIGLAAKAKAGWSATVHASATPTAATAPTTPTTPAPKAAAVPGSPVGLKASGGHGSVDLSWTDPADATITGYRYRTKTGTGGYGAWRTVAGAGASTVSHTITGLTATGAGYDIELQAGNSAGWSTAARASASTGLARSPTGVAAAPLNNALALSWDAPPARYGILRYQHRHKKTSSSSWSAWTQAPVTSTSRTITGLTNGTSYDVELAAENISGRSAAVKVTATPALPAPSAPSGLTATAAAGSIALSWTNPNNTTITGYQYRQRPSYDSDWQCWTNIWNTGADTTAQTLTKLAGSTAHRIQIRAVNAAGAGTASEVTATTPAASGTAPAAPTGLTATGANRSIALNWTNPGDATISEYQFRERPNGETNWRCWRSIRGSTAATTTHTMIGISNGLRYQVQVRAINPAGAGTPSQTAATPALPAPSAPSGLTATAAAGSIALSWTNPNNTTITGYQYRQRPSYDSDWQCWTNIWNTGADTTAQTLTKLAGSTAHRIQIRAVNAAGAGTASEVTATTPAASGTAPAAPTGLTATGANRSIALNWTNPGDATISEYQFRERPNGETNWRCWRSIRGSTAATTTHTMIGISNGLRYQVQVRAINPAGAGTPSQTAATPTAPTSP